MLTQKHTLTIYQSKHLPIDFSSVITLKDYGTQKSWTKTD